MSLLRLLFFYINAIRKYVAGVWGSSSYLQPLLGLFFALHSQHQGVRPLVDDPQFVLLLLAVFGDVSDAAP